MKASLKIVPHGLSTKRMWKLMGSLLTEIIRERLRVFLTLGMILQQNATADL